MLENLLFKKIVTWCDNCNKQIIIVGDILNPKYCQCDNNEIIIRTKKI